MHSGYGVNSTRWWTPNGQRISRVCLLINWIYKGINTAVLVVADTYDSPVKTLLPIIARSIFIPITHKSNDNVVPSYGQSMSCFLTRLTCRSLWGFLTDTQFNHSVPRYNLTILVNIVDQVLISVTGTSPKYDQKENTFISMHWSNLRELIFGLTLQMRLAWLSVVVLLD